jgi:hypothetical protein
MLKMMDIVVNDSILHHSTTLGDFLRVATEQLDRLVPPLPFLFQHSNFAPPTPQPFW